MFHLLPPLLAVSCLLTGSSALNSDTVCYGETINITSRQIGVSFPSSGLYFTPLNGRGPAKLLVEDKKLLDPRYKLFDNALSVPDVTERDEGVFSITLFKDSLFSVFTLRVSDCAVNVLKSYGNSYSFSLPRKAEFLEFTPLDSLDQPSVLWNRSNPQINRGRRWHVRRNFLEMTKLTQADNGHYNIREKNNKLASRTKLTVTEQHRTLNKKEEEEFILSFDLETDLCTVTFVPESGSEKITVMKAGRLVNKWSQGYIFSGRIRELSSTAPLLGIEIESLKTTDSGRFDVRDQNGNLALTLSLEVEPVPVSAPVYIGVAAGSAFSVIFCCYCLRKCCCGKSSSKRDSPVSDTAADPPVYYHDEPSQPSGPSSSTSPYVPTYIYNPALPKSSSVEPQLQEPSQPSVPSSSTSPHAPTHTYQPSSPLNLTEPLFSSGEPQVPVTEWQTTGPSASLNLESLVSGPEPQFELKGLTLPSAPPLSSDTSFCDVYTSDKLNFL